MSTVLLQPEKREWATEKTVEEWMELFESNKEVWSEKIEARLRRKRKGDVGKAGSDEGKGLEKRKGSLSQVEVSPRTVNSHACRLRPFRG